MFVIAVLSVLCQLPGTCDVAPHEVPAVAPEEAKGSGVKLHRPDGTEIFVNPRAIAFVRIPLTGETGSATIVFSSGAKQSTRESVHEIIDILVKDRPNLDRNDTGPN